ncbi:YgaP family membrane protein [Spirosoma fluminis]
MNFAKNIGRVDLVIRALLILDFVIPCLLGLVSSPFSYLMLAMAAVLFVSCVTGYCWLYDTLKISTRQEVDS